MSTQYIVTEFKVEQDDDKNSSVTRTFIGGFTEECLPYFIESKIRAYASDEVIEYKFMKKLVDVVLDSKKMIWDGGDWSNFTYLLIDSIKPGDLNDGCTLDDYDGPVLKDFVDRMRAEEKPKPKKASKRAKEQQAPVMVQSKEDSSE